MKNQIKKSKKKIDSREKLLETAVSLFVERGFKGTSIRGIADALGVSISNIYHYFGSKEGLWVEILRYSVEGLPDKLRGICALDMDPLEKFKLLLRTHLEFADRHRREAKIYFMNEDVLSDHGMEINRRLQADIRDIYLSQLTELDKLGLLHCRHLKIDAYNIFAVLMWQLRWRHEKMDIGSDQVHDILIDFIIRGLINQENAGKKSIKSKTGKRKKTT